MKKTLNILSLAGLTLAAQSDHWAVLVAGSSGYGNYRHQADICHAYQIMLKNGISPDHIITMAYDDIANNSENPFPGKMYNKPNGPDVYSGCNIDYRGKDVTPENFLAIIQGNKASLKGGNGKYLKSDANSKVFINFADHGAPGLIAFPSSQLYADDFITALKNMYAKKMYEKMVIYIEACESGSMF
jgi:legumain